MKNATRFACPACRCSPAYMHSEHCPVWIAHERANQELYLQKLTDGDFRFLAQIRVSLEPWFEAGDDEG